MGRSLAVVCILWLIVFALGFAVSRANGGTLKRVAINGLWAVAITILVVGICFAIVQLF
jgi:hypothetical protein